ncbi:methylated-DNA--[protein]-cysteine S-methyltransferase [Mucilaginibacter rigui]|uniref:Methylated-DNA--protein-cysteine methyltransferase n=1 Tax=Mucilaginibacter rigui TaxID=534635 RepID=A0ABR7X1V4_9SPHI|nr:methylated-DNA--[protein]-cysteine S-methyltransferase [Mucilaginibacter rigui]MBD1384558.1 methylated-DNA--[protein]-cysteine S-methyltransferase [Mucilaginibacter rigui]
MYEVYHRTPVGIALITADDTHITRVSIRDETVEETTTEQPLLIEATKQLDEYFAGCRKDFDLPLNQPGTDFQQEVWKELLKIPYGKTITYGQQSDNMKNPLAIRAIAAANGKNDLWIIVPCHRVIGSNGSLTGYAGGLWRKQWLLDHEARVMGTGQTKLDF